MLATPSACEGNAYMTTQEPEAEVIGSGSKPWDICSAAFTTESKSGKEPLSNLLYTKRPLIVTSKEVLRPLALLTSALGKTACSLSCSCFALLAYPH